MSRVTKYAMEQEDTSDIRTQYLFFIASIAKESTVLQHQDRLFFYTVTLDLLKNTNLFLSFNKNLLGRQMTRKQMYRRLSRRGMEAPDSIKHIVLSEENIMELVEKSEPMSASEIDQLVA